jgi:hypothetical protein
LPTEKVLTLKKFNLNLPVCSELDFSNNAYDAKKIAFENTFEILRNFGFSKLPEYSKSRIFQLNFD